MKKIFFLLFVISFLGCSEPDNQTSVDINCLNKNLVFKLYPTQNIWTFVKLDTRNGKMWQVQYSINNENRGEVILNSQSLLNTNEKEEVERFQLYATQNIYNFILLDQKTGKMWQAQWAQDDENRGLVPIN